MNHTETIPLYSIEAEQALLGTILQDKEALEKIESIVQTQDIYRADHRTIYAHIHELYRLNKPYDIITVAQFLKDKNLLADVGGQAYLGTLAHDYYSLSNIEAYAKIIKDKAILRQMIGLSNKIDTHG